jgi:hypothetical protein
MFQMRQTLHDAMHGYVRRSVRNAVVLGLVTLGAGGRSRSCSPSRRFTS